MGHLLLRVIINNPAGLSGAKRLYWQLNPRAHTHTHTRTHVHTAAPLMEMCVMCCFILFLSLSQATEV